MSVLHFVLILVYFLLVLANYRAYKLGNKAITLTIITGVFATVLLFSSNTAALDWSETELDMSGYRTLYEEYDVLEHPDFKLYYIFYWLLHIGQSMGISFYSWWAVMSVMGMMVIAIACKIHGFSYNLFLATFMSYYEFVFYSGFKFFYGFCFFLLAYGFLLRDDKYSKLKYVLVLLIAGGFHAMYYFYLILLIQPRKNPRIIVGAVALIVVVLTIIMRMSGSVYSYLAPFFKMLDNEHINRYTVLSVKMGFYLPVFLQVVLIYITFKMKQYKESIGVSKRSTDTLFYTSVLSLVFCPFYALALTFSRLQTALSLVLITSNSIGIDNQKGRSYCINMTILMVMSYWLVILVSGLKGFLNESVLPFFDIF